MPASDIRIIQPSSDIHIFNLPHYCPVNGTVDETAQKIRDMTIRGAGRIARAGSEALGDFARSYKGNDIDRFREDLKKAADTILSSRPTAVSLLNGVNYTIKGADREESVDAARELIIRNSELFCESSLKAAETVARIGAKRIADGDVIMTHCNSSMAIGVIKEAFRQGKDIRVYATESRPWRQGLITVRQLAEAGIDTTLIIDSAVRTVMGWTDKVFVGADTVTSQGYLVNKIGTSQLALSADEARVPFYCCTETYKFSPLTIDGDIVPIEERDVSEVVSPGDIPGSVKVFNPVFDTTPAKYIDAYITEEGVLSPGSVYGIMIEKFGYNRKE